MRSLPGWNSKKRLLKVTSGSVKQSALQQSLQVGWTIARANSQTDYQIP
ncbi:hypothetical protein J5X98_06030 [Leptothermofonsia sichuanensis E412]|nr:hypothetical protein [Leptothermofonsia sichuanensis]QZZ21973.1 hypothetical protein J5X98_06030 [Leptothermofonsia sichuanensis E412]